MHACMHVCKCVGILWYAMVCLICYGMLWCAMVWNAMERIGVLCLVCYGLLWYAIPWYATLCFAMWCYSVLCLCFAMLCYVLLCFAMLCFAMPCFSMLCCAVPCRALLFYALLCYAMYVCMYACMHVWTYVHMYASNLQVASEETSCRLIPHLDPSQIPLPNSFLHCAIAPFAPCLAVSAMSWSSSPLPLATLTVVTSTVPLFARPEASITSRWHVVFCWVCT